MIDEDALDRAQDKVFDAWEASTSAKRSALAREALAISPLCADAYVILAFEAASDEEALDLYAQGVDAGEKALGQTAFDEDAGLFWGLIETRPYMRARQGLADTLRELGRHQEAIDHYLGLLRLNPNDNQGVRYALMDVLLATGRDDEADALFQQYSEEDSAAWLYSRALHAFRTAGDGARSREWLSQAVSANPHIPDYLSGKKAMPKSFPAYYSPGDASEAIIYADGARPAWEATEGALVWLISVTSLSDADAAANHDQDLNSDAIDRAVLALLYLGLHNGDRVWKGFDWDALDRLHTRGLISDPATKAKSVRFTEEGLKQSHTAFRELFGK